MSRIQSTIGLVSGFPIGDTVDKLMQIAGIPRDNLIARTDTLKQERVAVTELTALLLSVQYATDNLGKAGIFQQRQATSSQSSLLSASVSGQPIEGTYQFTPFRTAQQHQLLTSGIKSDTEALGGGSMSFRFGPHVERAMELGNLNGGEGIDRGAIRITDRSGASAEIDLSTVETIDDVLDAINDASAINVTAVAKGDTIRLIDDTGATTANLRVQEVGGGTTAESLGLAGIDVADTTADGTDLVRLSADMELDYLNDGHGVARHSALPDIKYVLRDGTEGEIDLSPLIPGGSEVDEEKTLGEILDAINAAEPGKLEVEIDAGGDRLVIRDLTSGTGTFSISSMVESSAADDLGIAGESTDGEIVGGRLLGGLKSVLAKNVGGSEGLDSLGSLSLTDRSGATDTVSLAGAETLEEIIDAINGSGVSITASVNAARNGILLTDTSGGTTGNMIVASGDATETAEKLGIVVDDAVESIASGDLNQRIVSGNTLLDDLNGGRGVHGGKIRITDSNGVSDELDVNEGIETISDLIAAVNLLSADVEAELNETGDGIQIRDTAGGAGTLNVEEINSTTAADLHLLGETVTKQIEGEDVQVVDGSMTVRIDLDDEDSLSDLADRINELDLGMQATRFVDGSRNPYRLSFTSDRNGAEGALVVDMSGLEFDVQETVAAKDAMLVLGDLQSTAAGVLITSSSNTFADVIDGVKLTIHEASTSAVTINVSSSDVDMVANVQTMVDNYNRFREALEKHTSYDPDTDARAVLTGDSTALRLDADLSEFFSSRFFGAGSIQSLGEIGVDLNEDGSLSFDSSTLRSLYTENPDAVEEFFTSEEHGLSARFNTLTEQLSGEDTSLLANRTATLGKKIEDNEARIDWLQDSLDRQRERLLMSFYNMELAIGRMQANTSFLDSIKPLQLPSSND